MLPPFLSGRVELPEPSWAGICFLLTRDDTVIRSATRRADQDVWPHWGSRCDFGRDPRR